MVGVLCEIVSEFVIECDWSCFYLFKNLFMVFVIEVVEFMEYF